MSLNTIVGILHLIASPLLTLVLTVVSIVVTIAVLRFLKAHRRLAMTRYEIAQAELAALGAKEPAVAEKES